SARIRRSHLSGREYSQRVMDPCHRDEESDRRATSSFILLKMTSLTADTFLAKLLDSQPDQ
ncbi:MAG: hypothetical protein R6X32_00810, partial [Chloroflexota bacterium]